MRLKLFIRYWNVSRANDIGFCDTAKFNECKTLGSNKECLLNQGSLNIAIRSIRTNTRNQITLTIY